MVMMQELQPGDPQLIGAYRLRGRLGAGGMGRVYLGLSPGGRQVAVKVIRTDLAQDPEFRERFRREITVARSVSGLYTAPVIDADVDGPVPWLVTEYVRGPSLADAITRHGPLPAASVLALARGLAEGLGAIHAAGVVHRDLKPANVLLAEDGPRVIDFGISRAVEASALTHTGLVVGSPGFMSPEQADGRRVGPPSDIFSLGAVLAFAATGQGPFGTGSTPALIYRVVHNAPDLSPLPPELLPLIERCLAKDPAQRPAAAQLLAEAGAVYPATGWLPEPVTRTFSMNTAGPALTMTAAQLAAAADPPSARGRPAPGRAGRRRWRPLTVAAILAGLAGAGATAGFTLTAASAPAHRAQSVRQDAPVQTLAPTTTPASSSPAAARPGTASPPTAPAYESPPSTPPATMTPPPATSATPSTTPSPSTSTSPPPSTSTSASTPPTAASQFLAHASGRLLSARRRCRRDG
jgi:eukaryotic-like serine/threonine-protein kinase